jgi:hypothetical protein
LRSPPEYLPCANDGQTCHLRTDTTRPVTVSVFYGANGNYRAISFPAGTSQFKCWPSDLGVPDPAPGYVKACWVDKALLGAQSNVVASSPNNVTVTINGPLNNIDRNLVKCADDGEKICGSSYWAGVYGANGTYKKIAGRGVFTCLPSTFGIDDPLPFVKKSCYVLANNQWNPQWFPAAFARP